MNIEPKRSRYRNKKKKQTISTEIYIANDFHTYEIRIYFICRKIKLRIKLNLRQTIAALL